MRTAPLGTGLAETLWPRTRRQVMALLLLSPEREWHLREIARRAHVSPAAAQREAGLLTAVGILRRRTEAGRSYYRANTACPIFSELRSILAKTMAVAEVLRDALQSLQGLNLAFLFGPVARGEDDGKSPLDLVIVADAPQAEIADRLAFAQRRLQRDIAPIIYSAEDFTGKAAKRDRALQRALAGPTVPVVGETDPEEAAG